MQLIKSIKKLLLFCLVFSFAQLYAQNEPKTNVVFQQKDDTNKVKSLVNLAEEEINLKPAIAKIYAKAAYSIADSLNFENGKAIAAYFIGLADFETGDFTTSLFYFDISLKTFIKLKNKSQVGNIYNKIGNIYLQQNNYVPALENYFTSLDIAKELKDSLREASIYNNIGIIHHEQFEYSEALMNYNKSARIDSLIDDRQGLAQTLMNIGAIYMDMADYEKALEYYNKCLEIFNEFNDNANIAICYNNIASVFHEQANYELALKNYLKALEIYRNIGSQHGIASTCYSIGSFYNSKQEYNKAISYLTEALKTGEQIGSLRIEAGASLAFSEAYYNLKNYKKAYLYHVYFKKISDLLNNEENIKQITKVQMQYEFDQLQKEEAFKQKQREAKLKQQRMFIVFLGIGMVLMISLAFLIYRNYRIKKKDNILLAKQKAEIQHQRDEIQKQKQEITDSILYAKKIQTAALPPKNQIDKILKNYFILYKPRDIVSGDFYWITEVDNKAVIAAVDCTGHGVPGAFMSMLGVSALNDTIKSVKEIKAGAILNKLRDLIINSLHQTGIADEAKDGMDIALIVLDKQNMKLQYAGAYNPLYMIRKNELTEIKADRMPIGIYIRENAKFTNNVIDILPDDRFYIFSDGYTDQFGGPFYHKFKSKNFKTLLTDIHELPMQEQHNELNNAFETWKGSTSQIDDVIIIGIKI